MEILNSNISWKSIHKYDKMDGIKKEYICTIKEGWIDSVPLMELIIMKLRGFIFDDI